MLKMQFMLLAVVLSAATQANAAVIDVPGDQPTIQAAIGVAVAGDVILVQPGVYQEQIDFLGKAIVIKSDGGPEVTTIDGMGMGTVVKAVSGETPKSVLSGFRVRNGDDVTGGGVRIIDSSPAIVNCYIINSNATFGGGVYAQGGDPQLLECRIANNTASNGAGLFATGNATAVECHFIENIASFTGGGIQVENGNLELSNSLIQNNEAGFNQEQQGTGGGIHAIESTLVMGDLELLENMAWTAGGIWSYRCEIQSVEVIFNRNIAKIDGAAVYGIYGSHGYERCEIRNGEAQSGAGLMHLDSYVMVDDCEFEGNMALDSGGGFHGQSLAGGSSIFASTFNENIADIGAGLFMTQTTGFNLNATVFVSNEASSHGGGLCFEDMEFQSHGCVMLGNISSQHGAGSSLIESTGQFYGLNAGQNNATADGGVAHIEGGLIYYFGSEMQSNQASLGGGVACRACEVDVSGSRIRINDADVAGGGFHIDAAGMLHLGGTTVCGNAPDQIIGPFQEIAPNVIADECGSCTGDVDLDEFVGIDDLLAVVAAWGGCGLCPEDTNEDGVVDIVDLLAVLGHWGWCP